MRAGVEAVGNLISKAKRLMIPISFLAASLFLYKLMLAPKINEMERIKAEIARKESQLSSIASRITDFHLPSEEEMRRWEEVEGQLIRKLRPYDRLALMRQLVYLAYKAGVDRILDVQVEEPTDGSPLKHYKLRILFQSNRYDPIVNLLSKLDELPPLVEVESMRLEGGSPGISAELTLRVYELGGEGSAQE